MSEIDIKVFMDRERDEVLRKLKLDLVRGSGLLRSPSVSKIFKFEEKVVLDWRSSDKSAMTIHAMLSKNPGDSERELFAFLLGFNRSSETALGVNNMRLTTKKVSDGVGCFTADEISVISESLGGELTEDGCWLVGLHVGSAYQEVIQLRSMLKGATDE